MELVEVIIEGKEERVLGFIYGLAGGQEVTGPVIRCQDHDFSTEHHQQGIAKLLGIGGKYTNFILPQSLETPLRKALEKYGDALDLRLKNVQEVRALSFEFSGKIYSREIGDQVRALLDSPDDQLEISGYEPEEEVHEEAKGPELYAPQHDYELRISGKVRGPFRAVNDLYLKLKEFEQVSAAEMKCELG